MDTLQTTDGRTVAAPSIDLHGAAVVLADVFDLSTALDQAAMIDPYSDTVLALFRGELCVSVEAGYVGRTAADGWCHQFAFERFNAAAQACDGTRALFFTAIPRTDDLGSPTDWQVTCGIDGIFRSYEWSGNEG